MAIEETALEILKEKKGFELAFYIVLGLLVAQNYFIYTLIVWMKEAINNLKQALDSVVKLAMDRISEGK